MKISEKQGFTLIELLVVIAIIGILSSVVLASLNSARKKGRDARRIADVKQLQLALELAYDATGSYPLALTTANLVTPGYISVIPADPSVTGTCTTGAEASCYSYAALGSATNCSSYHLGTDLEVTGSSALSTDADAAVGTLCTLGGTSIADFSGVDSGKCKATDPGVACYDVKP